MSLWDSMSGIWTKWNSKAADVRMNAGSMGMVGGPDRASDTPKGFYYCTPNLSGARLCF